MRIELRRRPSGHALRTEPPMYALANRDNWSPQRCNAGMRHACAREISSGTHTSGARIDHADARKACAAKCPLLRAETEHTAPKVPLTAANSIDRMRRQSIWLSSSSVGKVRVFIIRILLSLQHYALDKLPHFALFIARSCLAVCSADVAFLIQHQRRICTSARHLCMQSSQILSSL